MDNAPSPGFSGLRYRSARNGNRIIIRSMHGIPRRGKLRAQDDALNGECAFVV